MVNKSSSECDHTLSGEGRKHRLYNSKTKEMLQEAVKTNVPAKHIKKKLLTSGAVGEKVNTLKERPKDIQENPGEVFPFY